MTTTAKPYATRPSLLVRLHDPDDAEAWETFYQRYYALVLSFAQRRGCTPVMAADVLQETMITMMRLMPSFEYNRARGQFRSFLLKVVQNHIRSAHRRERKYAKADTDDGVPRSSADSGSTEPHAALHQQWDKEWQRHLLLQALERVRRRVTPQSYDIFSMYVLQQRPVEEICQKMKTNRNAVYQYRARLVKMLREEVALLQEELGDVP